MTCVSSFQAAIAARWSTSGGATPTFGRYFFSAATISGSPATKPGAVAGHRRALGQRVEHRDVRPVAELERGLAGRVAEVQLGVRLVAGQHEPVPARQGRGLRVELERSGRARRVVRVVEPQDRHARPVDARRGPAASRPPRAAAARRSPCPRTARRGRRPGTRAAGSTTWSPPNTCASPKTASLEPSVGMTCVSGSSAAPKRRPAHAAIAARSSGRPDGARVRRERLDRGRQRLPDERRGLLARLTHAEVDDLGAGRTQPRAGGLQPHERVRAEAVEDGGELDHVPYASRTRWACRSRSIPIPSPRWWAWDVSPGPKLTAG